MKIINEKGRLFGIINIVDLGVLILALLVVYGAVVKFTGGDIKAPIVSEKRTVSITLKATGKSDVMLDAFKKGDQLMYSDLLVDGAFIQDVEIEPSMVNVQLPSGKIVPTPDPIYKDIYITFTAPVNANSKVLTFNNSQIRLGGTFGLTTKNAYTACYITKIKYLN